jgi:hypothetical protein
MAVGRMSSPEIRRQPCKWSESPKEPTVSLCGERLGTPDLQSPRNYSYETESTFSSQYEVELRRSRLGAPKSVPEV